jgi:hypothetical protein
MTSNDNRTAASLEKIHKSIDRITLLYDALYGHRDKCPDPNCHIKSVLKHVRVIQNQNKI